MKYHDPWPRRVRGVRRLAQAALVPEVWRHGRVVSAYWWDGHPNFGDDLTPWLLPAYGVVPVHRMPQHAQLAGVGSVLEFLPPDFRGAVWGSGLMNDAPHPLPQAHVLAVRGPLTRDRIEATGEVAFGDPGLLVSRRTRRPKVRWEVGFVPHGHHRAHAGLAALAAATPGARIVNVHQSGRRAVREIAACRLIVTTSLHGLVTADSFGIPAVWMTLEPPLGGGDFKFRDYEAAVTPGRSRRVTWRDGMPLADLRRAAWSADRDTVARLGDGLVRAIGRLDDEITGLRPFPRGALTSG
ncbi:polysaccharide pyruvyl transferase family protein [Microbacterium sp. E-13]|uniref:polysaccharide pyruvyl transferase family protein n=1 Tax=Microbacterium sp. E-13 TaxID=3404048 RepID=UPI003CF91FEA